MSHNGIRHAHLLRRLFYLSLTVMSEYMQKGGQRSPRTLPAVCQDCRRQAQGYRCAALAVSSCSAAAFGVCRCFEEIGSEGGCTRDGRHWVAA